MVIALGLLVSAVLTFWAILKLLHLIRTRGLLLRRLSIIAYFLDFGAIVCATLLRLIHSLLHFHQSNP